MQRSNGDVLSSDVAPVVSLTIASDNNSVPLSPASRPEFNRMAVEMRLKLAAAGSMAVATAQ